MYLFLLDTPGCVVSVMVISEKSGIILHQWKELSSSSYGLNSSVN